MSQPLRPNFGCGTLIVLAVAIFAASRLVPHGQGLKSKDPVVKTQTAAVKPKAEPTSSPQHDPTKPGSDEAESIIRDSISLLSTWLDQQKASPAVQPEKDPPKASMPVETPSLPQPEPVSTPKLKESPKIALDHPKEEGGSTAVSGWLDTLKSASEKVDAVMHPPESKPNPKTGTAAPLAGEIVFNNPWDQSVDQVARYLKKHTHDAASLNILEWGKVTKTQQGYEVRCTFRSKNVLGRETTQSRTFILGQGGEIKDIRD